MRKKRIMCSCTKKLPKKNSGMHKNPFFIRFAQQFVPFFLENKGVTHLEIVSMSKELYVE